MLSYKRLALQGLKTGQKEKKAKKEKKAEDPPPEGEEFDPSMFKKVGTYRCQHPSLLLWVGRQRAADVLDSPGAEQEEKQGQEH